MADAIETDIFENSLEGKEAIERYIIKSAEASVNPNDYRACYHKIKELDGDYNSTWLPEYFDDEKINSPTEKLIVLFKSTWIERQLKYYGNCWGREPEKIFRYLSESIRELPVLSIDIGISLGKKVELLNHSILSEYFVDYDEEIMFTRKAMELVEEYLIINVPDEEELDCKDDTALHIPKFLSQSEIDRMNEENARYTKKVAQLKYEKKEIMKKYNQAIEWHEDACENNSKLLSLGAEDGYMVPCRVLYNVPAKGMKSYVAYSKNPEDEVLQQLEGTVVRVVPMDDFEENYSMFDEAAEDDTFDDVVFEEASADESIDNNDVESVTAVDDSEYQAEIELSDSFDEDETQLN